MAIRDDGQGKKGKTIRGIKEKRRRTVDKERRK